MKIICFDTETTGLLDSSPGSTLSEQPRIVQWGSVSLELDDETDVQAIEFQDKINEIFNPGCSIPEQASNVHGITDELVKGKPSITSFLLDEVIPSFEKADLIVCHNSWFDMNMLHCEVLRIGDKTATKKVKDLKHKVFCTMKSTIDLIKIPGRRGMYKYPKLQELHTHLFGFPFENAHDAFADIEATAKCFVQLIKTGWLKVSDGKVTLG